jgi:conjugative transposon protein traF
MESYHINKGIGRSVEFKGLKAQYLFIFAGGLLAMLLLTIVLYMAGANLYCCLIFGAIGISALVWGTFYLNGKYGTHGLMKQAARKRHPKYLRHQRSPRQFIRYPKPKTTLNEK